MKILVYGAGAIGGYIAAKLAHAGNEVTAVVREVTAQAIDTYGLTIVEDDREFVARLETVTTIPQAFRQGQSYDLIIMGMKSYDIKQAMDPLVAFCPSPPPIMTTQNGINVERPLAEQFGAEKIIAGSFTLPISKETSTRLIVERENGGIALSSLHPKTKVKPWANLLKQAEIETDIVKNYESMKWSKALLNIVGNATSAILNRPPSIIYRSERLFNLEMRMLEEALAVMKAKNIPIVNLPGWSPKQLAFAVRRLPAPLLKPILTNMVKTGRGEKMPSFHIDLSNHKGKSEVIFHNGAIAQAGKEVNVPTPVNTTLTAVLLKLVQQKIDWREFDGKPKRLFEVLNQIENR